MPQRPIAPQAPAMSSTSAPTALHFLLFFVAGCVNRHQQRVIEYLLEENRVLREQLNGRRLRLTNDQRRRLAVKGRVLGRKALGKVADIADLVVRMANETPGWGYTRIRDALRHVGHGLGRNTVKRILLDRGMEPAPERNRKPSWTTFLRAHFGEMAAADFFTVEVLTLVGLVRYSVFFVMRLESRKIEIAGITCDPCGTWMEQIARHLSDCQDGFLLGIQYLILDRDPLYTARFRSILKDGDVSVIRLPARSPNLNAHAERFVLSIKSECLDRIIPLGERHLRRAVREYAEHYHFERHHQGIGNRIIDPDPRRLGGIGEVVRSDRLGGLLNFYYREAA